jgi:hypothetical protein
VSPQSQIFRQDVRQMPAASDQGMLSMGAQGGNSIQQVERYSGAESSTANNAVRKPQGAEILAPFLGNYLLTSQQSQSNAMNAIVINPQSSYQAMTGIIVKSACVQTVTSDSEHVFAMATKKFRLLPLWILQRMANAKIKDRQLGKETLTVLKAQRPELANILNQSDTIGGMYAKWRIFLQGVKIDLQSISSAQAESLSAFTAGLDAASAQAIAAEGTVAGLEEARAALDSLQKAYKDAQKRSNTDKIDSAGLSKQKIKAIQDVKMKIFQVDIKV